MAWSKGQARSFAKEIQTVEFERCRALKYLTSEMRTALVEAHVLAIVLGQAAETVRVEDVRTLLLDVREALQATYGSTFFE